MSTPATKVLVGGAQGKAGINPRGDYDPAATYLLRDAVTFDVTNDRAYVFARKNLTAGTAPSVDGDGMIISDANWYVLMRLTKGGWSPIFGSEIDGLRVVQKITDWTGGEGMKPGTGYLGASGIVSDIADGLDIAGPLTNYFDTQKTAAETARSGAEAARDIAVTARDEAEASAATVSLVYETLDTDYTGTLFLSADGKIVNALPDAFDFAAVNALLAASGTMTRFDTYETLDPDYAFAIFSGDGYILYGLPAIDPILDRLSAVEQAAITTIVYETLDTDYPFYILSADGYILSSGGGGSSADIADLTARVTTLETDTTALTARVDAALDVNGIPIEPVYGAEFLNLTPVALRRIRMGLGDQWPVVMIGDSYTQSLTIWTTRWTQEKITDFGFAGVGWIGFAWHDSPFTGTYTNSVQPGSQDYGACWGNQLSLFKIIGTWTGIYHDGTTNSPSISSISSSTPGDYVRFTVAAGHNYMDLAYGGDGTGAVSISWDDGAHYSSPISLTGVNGAFIDLSAVSDGVSSGVPSGAFTCRIKVESGNVTLFGASLKGSADGIIPYRWGQSGSHSGNWATVDQAKWAAYLANTGAKLVIIFLGTNDQTWISSSEYDANIRTMVANVRVGLPYADLMLVTPAENNRTNNAYPMSAIAAKARAIAVENRCCHVDLQDAFGDPANYGAEYAYTNTAKQFLRSDLVHPTEAYGGVAIIEQINRVLCPGY